MAGPGGREVGRVSIRVLPDTTKFVPSLRKYLTRIERTLELEIPVTLDASGVAAEARRASERAQKAAREVKIPVTYNRKALSALRKDLGTLKRIDVPNLNKAIGIGALAIASAAAVPHVLALAGSLTQVAGVAGLLPGLLGATVAGISTLVIGFQGVGDALKVMNDPEQVDKFRKAMDKLAPAAQQTVLAFKGLSPAFRALRLDVQQRLFTGVSATVQELASSYLPELRRGLGRIASATSGAFQFVADASRAKGVLADLRPTLASVATATSRFGRGVAQLVPAFSELTKVGASFLPGLADGFEGLAAKFNAFIQRVSASGELKDFIQGGLDAVKDLASVLGSAGRILSGLFRAAEAGGGTVLSTFADGLGRIADLVNTPAFQSGLTQVFAGLRDAAKPIMDALPSIADALVAVAPGIASLAKAFGTGLGEALKTFADIVVQLAPTLNAWAESLANLDPKLLGLITAAIVLAPLAGTVVSALAGLGPILAAIASPVGLVVAAIAGLVAGFVLIYQNSATVREGVASVIDAVQGLWTTLQPIVAQIVAVFREQWPQIAAVTRAAWSTIQTVISTALQFMSVQIQAVTAFISGVWAIFGTTIVSYIKGALAAVLSIVRGGLNIIQGIFRAFSALLKGDWSGLWAAVKQVATGALQVISGVVGLVINNIKGVISGGMAFVKTAWSAAWTTIRTAASTAVSSVVTTVSGLPGRILAAIGDLGSLLYDAGARLIQGLADGITSRIRNVTSAVSGIASKIKGFFPGSPVKEGPLTSWNNGAAGQRLVEMLTDGMAAMESQARSTARELASTISSGFDPALSVSAAGAAGRGGRSITVEGNVGWGPEDLADAIDEREAREDSLFPVFGGGS
jgi:hypothetical protein